MVVKISNIRSKTSLEEVSDPSISTINTFLEKYNKEDLIPDISIILDYSAVMDKYVFREGKVFTYDGEFFLDYDKKLESSSGELVFETDKKFEGLTPEEIIDYIHQNYIEYFL